MRFWWVMIAMLVALTGCGGWGDLGQRNVDYASTLRLLSKPPMVALPQRVQIYGGRPSQGPERINALATRKTAGGPLFDSYDPIAVAELVEILREREAAMRHWSYELIGTSYHIVLTAAEDETSIFHYVCFIPEDDDADVILLVNGTGTPLLNYPTLREWMRTKLAAPAGSSATDASSQGPWGDREQPDEP